MVKKAQAPAPDGFLYQTDILQIDEERDVVDHIRELALKKYEFRQFTTSDASFITAGNIIDKQKISNFP